MRTRIITSPCFNGDKVIGAILFEKTMDGEADGKPVPQALWKRGVVPFLKVDKGLEDEADGVKLMKPMPELDALAASAPSTKGMFGTKMRSVIERASPTGIAAIVEQQFEVAKQISAHGLMPIIEPEVSIKSPERAAVRRASCSTRSCKALDALAEGAGDAQADAAGRGQPVRAAGRPSARAARRRAVGRVQPRRGVPRAGAEPRHDRQLQPRACCPTCATR